MNMVMTISGKWATVALNDGVGIDVVQEVLGHADISTTRRHYATTLPERAQAALVNMPFPKADKSTETRRREA
jgi:integrase